MRLETGPRKSWFKIPKKRAFILFARTQPKSTTTNHRNRTTQKRQSRNEKTIEIFIEKEIKKSALDAFAFY